MPWDVCTTAIVQISERGSHSVEAQQDFDILFPNDATTVFTKTIDITFSERMGSLLNPCTMFRERLILSVGDFHLTFSRVLIKKSDSPKLQGKTLNNNDSQKRTHKQ